MTDIQNWEMQENIWKWLFNEIEKCKKGLNLSSSSMTVVGLRDTKEHKTKDAE